MENNYHNRDLEQFVKQSADQYRMFPSEQVWKNINGTLHTRKRWYGIALGLLALTAGTVTWIMLSPSGSKKVTADNQAIPVLQKTNNIPSAEQKIPGLPTQVLTHQSITNQSHFITPITINKEETSVPADLTGSPLLSNYAENIPAHFPVHAPKIAATPVREEGNALSTIVSFPEQAHMISITDQATDDNADAAAVQTKKQVSNTSEKQNELFPMSIESVVNSFKANSRKNRFSLQLYFTPTISYRQLRENKSYLNSTAFASSPYSIVSLMDINSVVTHKPGMGLELGLSAAYRITRDLKFKAGLQFNVSRYDIRAFTYNGEVATIALNRGYDSVSAWTNYRNLGGYKQDWLQNLYFSVSAPIGAELKLSGDNKTSLGISGTIQPTYIIGDRAYLISTDYKNYAEVPGLVRRLNISTSFEPFVAYTTGKLKWQVGPQIRYQMLSSFQQKYPIRENVFDFGLKVGIQLNH